LLTAAPARLQARRDERQCRPPSRHAPCSRSPSCRPLNVALPVLKGGFCVSTVSIVCGRAMAVVAGCTYWTGRRLARPRTGIVIADDADGADGIFLVWILITLVPARPSCPEVTSIPRTRRHVCATTQAAPGPRGFLAQRLAALEAAANSSCKFTLGREPADFHLHVVSSHAHT
jgi:hypothetical protein